MNSFLEPDDNAATGVLDAVRESLHDVTMSTAVERIESVGRSRIRRRRLACVAAASLAVAGLVVGLDLHGGPSTPPTLGGGSARTQEVHIVTAAYVLDSQADGTIHVSWDKSRYVADYAGLASALQKAGFPVLMKFGEFCTGPNDDASLAEGGEGPGVAAVVKGEDGPDGTVTFVFTPSAMPAGRELFIGYLSQAQLAITHGRPGSIERLVPATGDLICSTQVPAVAG
ncbi:MAG TPA: hypothetical protein VGL26_09860 [Jatrophihabitans sp.]|jgi:hypothetical protein